MKPEKIYTQIAGVMKGHQVSYRIVGIEHLPELETKIQQQYSNGSFEEKFFQERLTSFRFKQPDNQSNERSVIIVAIPQPIVIVNFSRKGSVCPVTIPPTYDLQTDKVIKESIEKILNPAGYIVSRARIPEKMLAACSGLMQYGRNNIGYVPGFGSFHRTVAFYTDLPCDADSWEPPVLMERCLRCKACIKACPTMAIGEDRFLLHAERCITFHNEHLKEMPDYINPSLHHCLLGCMICQKVCPENRKFADWVEVKEHFSEEETSLILDGIPLEKLAPDTRQKLERLSLAEDYSLLARNLGLLLD
jgi:epoxyqueuosine reductase